MQEKLRQYLKEHNMTQTELALRMHAAPEYVNRILNGRVPLTSTFIGRFAQAFGFDVAAQVFTPDEDLAA